MPTTLCLDFGNTRLKWAVFSDGEIRHTGVFQGDGLEDLNTCLELFKPERSILSSVVNHPAGVEEALKNKTLFHKLDHLSKVPITTPVGKPESIGADRLALVASAVEADKNLIGPLFTFHNSGLPLPNNWTTIKNGAAFGTDYYTRAAVAKSNIFVNSERETKYFYQDSDGSGQQLNGNHDYTVTFAAGQTPPVKGFWSLTLYNQHHFFSPNEIRRYSVGTKNKTLVAAPDGSLTIYVQSTPPEGDKRANWLPAPKEDFVLYVRSYWPEEGILNGNWTPPVVTKVK